MTAHIRLLRLGLGKLLLVVLVRRRVVLILLFLLAEHDLMRLVLSSRRLLYVHWINNIANRVRQLTGKLAHIGVNLNCVAPLDLVHHLN